MPEDRDRPSIEEELGHKVLNKAWAKAEIFLGLAAASIGLGMLVRGVTQKDVAWLTSTQGVALMTFGGYLAMAGSRSHLYQSSNRQTEYLAEKIAESAADLADSGEEHDEEESE